MYMGKVEIENVTVPAGDQGEQLIANLILALIASELHADGNAGMPLRPDWELPRELAH